MSRRDLTSDTAQDKFDVEAVARHRGVDAYQVRAMTAVDDRLWADLVSDFRRPLSPSGSLIPDSKRSDGPQRQPSGGTIPIERPPGIDLIDQMCDAQDRRDRAIALQQQMELDWIKAQIDRRDPHKARTEYSPTRRFDAEVSSFHREKDD